MKTAYIGLGHMGGEQARLIAASEHDLAVFDAYPPALAAFAGKARIATSPAHAAQGAEIVQICVRDDAQVLDAVLGANGVADAMAPGTLLLVHSTIRQQTVARLTEALTPRGIRLVDAPVTRTRIGQEGRFVLTMAGGDPADIERARPLLDLFSTEVVAVGPSGSAMALKIANNLVSWVSLMVGSQANRIAVHFGVPYESLRTVMKSNGNLSPTVEAFLGGQLKMPAGSNPEYDTLMASQAGIGEKDLDLAIDCALAAGLDPRMIREAQSLIRPTFVRS